jgi:hemerythrin superfamily protein
MSKPKRNDPCYCGSGKKYKQCHLKIDQEAEREERARKEAARFLRRDLLTYARDERFAEDFALALPLYWDGLYDHENAEEMSHYEALRFFDWFMFDYQPQEGPRFIELYQAEKQADLSEHQQKTLANWLTAGPSDAYELVSYEGQILQLRNFTTGEEYEVYEPTGRGQVEIGEVILTRLVQVEDHLEFSTSAAYLPAAEITNVADKLAAARQTDAETHPDATYDEFMRRHTHLLVHHALAEAKVQGRPPVARLNPDREDKKVQTVARQMRRRRR